MSGAIGAPINSAFKGDYLRPPAGRLGIPGGRRAGRPRRPRRRDRIRDRHARARHRGGRRCRARSRARRCTRWDELLGLAPVEPSADIGPGDLATIVYTGGTTGPSKGCMLSHNYHVALSTQIATCWRRTADDVLWTPLPLFHFNALTTGLVGALVAGGASAISGKFSVSGFWPEINRVGAHGRVAARLDGVPPRQRRSPPRHAELGRARGEHHDAPDRCGTDAGRDRSQAAGAVRRRRVQRRLRHDRGEPAVVDAARRRAATERGRRDQRRVLRRAHLRRRRPRGPARTPTARSCSGRSVRT